MASSGDAMMRASRSIALVAATAVLGSGCSFLMMREPAPRQQQPIHVEPDCSQGRGLPTLDLVGAGAAAFSGLMTLLLLQIADGHNDEEELWVAGLFGGSTLLLGASSISGYGTARRCRAAIQDFYTMRSQIYQPPYQPYQPPSQPPLEAPGTERGSCRPTVPACEPGLVCASRYCVRPPGAAPIGPHL